MRESAKKFVAQSAELEALQSLALWSTLPAATLARIATRCQVRRFAKNQEITCLRDCHDEYHYLVAGEAKLQMVAQDGRVKVVEIVGSGHGFEEYFASPSSRPPLCAIALGTVRILSVPKSVVYEELQAHPGFAMRLVQDLARRMGALLHDIDSQAFDTAIQRFVRYLAQLVDPLDAPSARVGATVTLPAGKAVVASRLSLSPEYFSRMLRQLESEQLIAVDNRSIFIPSMSRLWERYGPGRHGSAS